MPKTVKTAKGGNGRKARRGPMSAATRKKIGRAMKRRWAKRRREKALRGVKSGRKSLFRLKMDRLEVGMKILALLEKAGAKLNLPSAKRGLIYTGRLYLALKVAGALEELGIKLPPSYFAL